MNLLRGMLRGGCVHPPVYGEGMARRRSWVESWEERQPVWETTRAALDRATNAFSREPGDGIQADDDREADLLLDADFAEHTDALHDIHLSVEAMSVELAHQMIGAGYSLRETAERLRTNHATVRKWLQEADQS